MTGEEQSYTLHTRPVVLINSFPSITGRHSPARFGRSITGSKQTVYPFRSGFGFMKAAVTEVCEREKYISNVDVHYGILALPPLTRLTETKCNETIIRILRDNIEIENRTEKI